MNVTELDGKKLYKVVGKNAESLHGGALTWDLPNGGEPGKWAEVDGELILCERGLHLTTEPTRWIKPDCRIFEVEARDLLCDADGNPAFIQDGAKCVARSVRLTRELSDQELIQFNIFRSGSHSISSGSAFAYDSAVVTASGSAVVTAYGSARVTAYGSAVVTASGSAVVTAYDSAVVTASGSARVTAYGSAVVTAYGSAVVTAYGSAVVTAYDSARVTAYDSARVTAYDSARVTAYGSARVTAYGSAVVTAYGSAVVTASGSAVVTAYDSARVTASGKAVVRSTDYYAKAIVDVRELAVHLDYRTGDLQITSAKGKLT